MGIETSIELLKYRRTKIVATLGPSTRESSIIARLIASGADVFRLNMSHGTHDEHREIYQRIRTVTDKLKKPIAVLADLSGPKIRVGSFSQGGVVLAENDYVTVTTRDVEGRPGLIPSQYMALAELLIDLEIFMSSSALWIPGKHWRRVRA